MSNGNTPTPARYPVSGPTVTPLGPPRSTSSPRVNIDPLDRDDVVLNLSAPPRLAPLTPVGQT